MKTLRWISLAVLLSACSSMKEDHIRLPETTPFDSSTMARHAYLQAYEDGYRAAQRSDVYVPGYERGPYPSAREMGWRAGAAAARDIGHPPSGKLEQ